MHLQPGRLPLEVPHSSVVNSKLEWNTNYATMNSREAFEKHEAEHSQMPSTVCLQTALPVQFCRSSNLWLGLRISATKKSHRCPLCMMKTDNLAVLQQPLWTDRWTSVVQRKEEPEWTQINSEPCGNTISAPSSPRSSASSQKICHLLSIWNKHTGTWRRARLLELTQFLRNYVMPIQHYWLVLRSRKCSS